MSRLTSRVRRSRLALLGLCALVLCAPAARAQDPDPLTKLDEKSRFAVQLLIDSAANGGLPAHSLQSVAYHGIAKKADPKLILQAVRAQLRYLRTARTELAGVSDEELEAAAAVLQAGAKPAQLAAFRARPKGRNAIQAFIIWADLLTRQVALEDVASAVTKLWQDGADDATFQSLWSNVQADISQGQNPGAALQNRIRETPGRPAKITTPEGEENRSSR